MSLNDGRCLLCGDEIGTAGCTRCTGTAAKLAPALEPVVPSNVPPIVWVGWTCPKCGGGVSPFVDRCPCTPFPPPRCYTLGSAGHLS